MLDSARYRAGASKESDPGAERSLTEDIMALVSDGRLLAEAEIDFHRKRAAHGAKEGQRILAGFAIAAVLLFFALMALVFGLVLALGEVITYWGSTALVTGVLVVIAVVLVSRAKARLARLKVVLSDKDDAE